jgi:hypothetical protein
MPETEAPATEATETETKEPSKAPEVPEGAENPDAVKKALAAERKAAKDARKQAEELAAKVKDYEDRDKTEQEKLSAKLDSLTSEAKATKAENLRLRVALEKKLPAELIDRLKGNTLEEITADADELLKLVKPTDANDFDGGARQPAPEPKTPGQSLNETVLGALRATRT